MASRHTDADPPGREAVLLPDDATFRNHSRLLPTMLPVPLRLMAARPAPAGLLSGNDQHERGDPRSGTLRYQCRERPATARCRCDPGEPG